MDHYQVIYPSPLLAPFVKNYWFMECEPADNPVQRIIPCGCVTLMFHRADRIFSSTTNDLQPKAFLCGQSHTYTDLLQLGKTNMVCVVFQPYGAKAFFDAPVNELDGLDVGIELLNDLSLKELEDRLHYVSNDYACVQLIENYLMQRLKKNKAYNFDRMNLAVASINKGEQDIKKLASDTCLSYKQFKRVFTEYVGTNPKDFLRIVRFQKALHVLQTVPDINFTQLAFDSGCYDQPHLIREFKAFSGYTPTEYISICNPYSDYFSH